MQNQKRAVAVIIALGLAVFVFVFILGRGTTKPTVALDGFAECLTGRGWTMYGAYWCPHCQNEKAALGTAFKYIDYVECTKEPQACTAAGIKGYPTWITKDGRRFEGELGIDGLARESGCSVTAPQNLVP